MLVVQGERRREQQDARQGVLLHSERRFGSFYRAIPLPKGVDESRIRATFRHGVLEVVVPAPNEARGRDIPIEDDAGGARHVRPAL